MNTDVGPAFPNKDELGNMIPGMSIRDWFAGQALAGLLACPDISGSWESIPKWAYTYADAILRARERGQELNDDEAWFGAQAKGCLHRDGDGVLWASCEASERIVAAGGSTRVAAIRALRAKVKGGAQ